MRHSIPREAAHDVAAWLNHRRDGAVIHFEHGALRFAFAVTHFT